MCPACRSIGSIVEGALKKAILHRRNSLFYKTQRGARVGDLFMSLIYTCQMSSMNPFDYLTALLRNFDQPAREPAQWMPLELLQDSDRCRTSFDAN
jgi:hypothetical protein